MKELKLKDNSPIATNWEDIIILPDFFQILDLYTLKEVSLLSKLVRIKLNPKLFEIVTFNGSNFDNYFNNSKNLLWGYFNYLQYSVSRGDEDFDDSLYVYLKVEPAIKEFENQLESIKNLVKRFHFIDAGSACYYLFSILKIFKNLTILEVTHSTIPLIKLSELANSLPKLESIGIFMTTLTKIPTEEFLIEDIQFPKILKDLSVIECKIGSNELLLNPYSFLFDKANSEAYNEFTLPATPIPSLLTMCFIPESLDDCGLNQFLLFNPQLKFINFKSSSFNQEIVNYIQNSKILKKLEIFCEFITIQQVKIPTLSSIKELEFFGINQDFYPIIQELCIFSPNLEELRYKFFSITELTTILDNTLANIIPSCYNLKEFILDIFGEFREVLDFSRLVNVEVLTIKSELVTILNVEFSEAKNLKMINLYYEEVVCEYDIKEKFSSIKDWRFEYKFRFIKGYKV